MRETRTIILDEAFFSTKNRLKGFIRMLREGYLDHPFLNDLMREMCPPKFLDSLYKMKKIIFVGDPYQLAVSVEAKDAGIEKYLHEEGDPLWYYRHSFMGHVRMLDDLERYQLSTLTKNYRFSDVPDELASAIKGIRRVIYKNEDTVDEYKSKLKHLINVMVDNEMIQFKATDVVKS